MSPSSLPLRTPHRPQSLLIPALAAGAMLFACQAHADDSEPVQRSDSELDEVTVTGVADRKSALLELVDDPKPITVVAEDDLQTFDLVDLQDALPRLGNVRFNNGNPRTSSFSLRGLTAGPSSDKIDPSIGLTIDGVPYAYLALGNRSDLVDVEQVNVTRGPQGTTGARHTSVGQINVITRRPSFTPEASASVTVGELNALRLQAQAGGPIIDDKLAWRITLTRNQQEGYWKNEIPDLRGLQSHQNIDRTYGRVQLLFTPTSTLSIRALYDHSPKGGEYVNGLSFGKPTPERYADPDGDGPLQAGYVDHSLDSTNRLNRRWFTQQSAYTADDFYKYNVYLDTSRAIESGGKGSLIDINWQWADDQNVQWLSSWRNHYFLASNDDGTPFDISRNGGFIVDYAQGSHQLTFTGKLGGLADYTAGLFYLFQKYDSLSRTRQGNDAGAWNANVAQYNTLDANSAGRELMLNSRARLYTGTQSYLDNYGKAAFAQLDWHLTTDLTLTTGLRFSRERRELTESSLVLDNGYGASLNPVSSGNVQLGGFNSNATGALTGTNSDAQLLLADAVALQYFGVASTGTPGGAYNSLTNAQRAQVAAAKAIRLGSLGGLYNLQDATPWEGNVYTGQLSLANRFNDNLTAYFTTQYGEKPGITQFQGQLPGNAPGAPGPRNLIVGKEKTTTFELGVRTNWLDDDLILNANVFRAAVKGFQQTVFFYDELLTQLSATPDVPVYTSGVGGVPKVRSQGVELDLVYSGIRYTSLRFSGAYTDAKYIDYPTAGQPVENNGTNPETGTTLYNGTANFPVRYRSLSGRNLPNAPKVQFNVTADYRVPVFGDKEFHTSLSYTYSGRENGDAALSEYGWTRAYGLADYSLGFGRRDQKFDLNVIVRNLFDEERGDAGWSSYTVYQRPRWVGVVVSGRFF